MKENTSPALWTPQGHLTSAALAAVLAGAVPADESSLEMVEHIGCCEQCAAAFANAAEAGAMAPPAGFQEATLARWKAESQKPHKTNKHRQTLILYTYRAAVAACVALGLALSGSFRLDENWRKILLLEPGAITGSDSWLAKLGDNLSELSHKIFFPEVNPNDTETQ